MSRKSKSLQNTAEKRLCGQMKPRLSECHWCIHRDACPWYQAAKRRETP